MSDLQFIAMVFSVMGGGCALITAPFWLGQVPRLIPMRPSQTVALVIEMLRSPHGWSFDRHYARHETGVALWVANGASSLGLSTNGEVSPHNMGGGNVRVGIRERNLLFRAVARCRAAIEAEKLERELVAWSERVSRYADNVVQMERRA